ncbi:MAG: CamS family sex pheromone protein [Lysinibacillus sp.]
MKRLRRFSIGMALVAVLVAGCTPSIGSDQELIQEDTETEVETTIIPSMQLNDSYYKTLVPYKESVARGLVVSNMNTKYNIKEVENGLMRISQNEFPTDEYYFQEGQYIDSDMVKYWVARENQTGDKGSEYQGLNPSSEDKSGNELPPEKKAEKAPIYLAHVVEQNYLTKTSDNKVAIGGVSIGLALNSIYYYQKEQYGEFYEQKIDDAKLEAEGKKIAEEVVDRLRQRVGLEEVPIVVALYKQEPKNSIVPGTYFAYSVADKGKNDLGDWKGINEKFVTFPLNNPEDVYREMNKKFQNFKQDIDKYFSNYTSVIGTGFYQNNTISSLEIEIPIQFYGTSELIGFTQYLTGVMLQQLPNDLVITIEIKSMNGSEGI